MRKRTTLAAGILGALAGTSAYADVSFYDGFESGVSDEWRLQNCESHSLRTVTEGESGAPKPRSGDSMARFELRPGDRKPLACTSVGEQWRSEIATTRGIIEPGVGSYIGWSVYIPEGWDPAFTDKKMFLAQIHGGESCTSGATPLLVFNASKDDWGFYNNWQGENAVVKRGPIADHVGKWTDWVVYYKASSGSDGRLKIWKDGELFAEKDGPNACDVSQPYFKVGLYQPPNGNVVVYADEVRIGDSMEDVTPPPMPVDPTPTPEPDQCEVGVSYWREDSDAAFNVKVVGCPEVNKYNLMLTPQ